MEGYCEHGNEPSGFREFGKILEEMSDWRLLKKDSDPWSYLGS
jgi:hypothetical protein